MRLIKLYGVLAALATLLIGCVTSGSGSDTNSLTAEPLIAVTGSPVAVAQATTPTPTMTIAPTQAGPTRLAIWWPEPLAPLENSDAVDVLSEQMTSFQTAQGNVVVDLRWKNENDPGGILSTLRTASPVAPGALPDLTLLRRDDLLAAVQAGLIYPLEGRISTAVVGDLYGPALQLGQVNGQLYGLPYMLNVQHMAYRPLDDDVIPGWRYADLLANDMAFVFPAGQTGGVSSLFLTQYLAAGGTLPAIDGAININAEALRDTLQFYEDAAAAGIIDPTVLNYNAITDYRTSLAQGTFNAGLVDSTTFLQLRANGVTLLPAPVPTTSGIVTGELDGWMWVLTTPNADRQALAVRFLNWMMNATRQGEYSRTVDMLPSQRSALQYWNDEAYVSFTRELLTNATLPLSDIEGGAFARTVQSALVAVISGQTTAEEATASLISQIEG